MNKIDIINEYANKLVGDWFDNAPTGQGTTLKNYTSGDGKNEGFESITEKIMKKAMFTFGLENRCVINGEYFECSNKENDPQRLDNHVWIDGKVVILEECRAWIDKPFYTLKRAVVRNFMVLPHTKKYLSDDVKFIFTSLARDVTNITKTSLDIVQGYGELITEVNISGHPRRTKKYNYFDNGYSQKELNKYIETICGVFSKYE